MLFAGFKTEKKRVSGALVFASASSAHLFLSRQPKCNLSITLNIASSDIRREKVCGWRRRLTYMFELRSFPVPNPLLSGVNIILISRTLQIPRTRSSTGRTGCQDTLLTKPNRTQGKAATHRHPFINVGSRNRLPQLDGGVVKNWNRGATS